MAPGGGIPGMEKVHRVLGKLLASQNFESPEAANAYLRELVESGGLNRLAEAEPADPKEEAQDLAYRAMEAATAKQARELTEQALKLDPDCVDALIIRAQAQPLARKEYIARLRLAVEAGERSLGSDFIRDNSGHFWGMIETRPLMRAKHGLGMALVDAGQNQEAISQLEEMLELNPNDNQGVRDILLGLYLLDGDLTGADRLLGQYRDDCGATFVWGRVLRDLIAGNLRGAASAIKKAMRSNPHVAEVLAGREGFPKALPGFYSPGSEDEAAYCLLWLGRAWMKHPEAIAWVAGSTAGLK
ncbi:MAG: tetratricopeptide repeat protein [Acidobacteriota bacterium]